MSNVVAITGIEKIEKVLRAEDLLPGQSGYTTPWQFDMETETLSPGASISSKGGTASLYVLCVSAGQYAIRFEEPTYSNLGFL